MRLDVAYLEQVTELTKQSRNTKLAAAENSKDEGII